MTQDDKDARGCALFMVGAFVIFLGLSAAYVGVPGAPIIFVIGLVVFSIGIGSIWN